MNELFESTDDQQHTRQLEAGNVVNETYSYDTVVIVFSDGTKDLILVGVDETIPAVISHHCYEMDYDENDVVNYHIQN